jgi:hypothetical protein
MIFIISIQDSELSYLRLMKNKYYQEIIAFGVSGVLLSNANDIIFLIWNFYLRDRLLFHHYGIKIYY